MVGLFGVLSGLAVTRHRPGPPAASTLVYVAQAPDEAAGANGVAPSSGRETIHFVLTSLDPGRPPWEAIVGLAGAVVLFGLLVAIGVSAARRGVYAAGTRRLVGVTGLFATGAGVAAILVTAISNSPQWSGAAAPFLVWVLIGCALLAIREVLARAGALRSELDGVI